MQNEKIYFDEEVKGHKLLVTSKVIAFRGERFETSRVDGVSTAVFRHSVNAIPTYSSYITAIAYHRETITVECAGIFWFGRSQHERLRTAITQAVGVRLIREAIRKLLAGGTLVFEHKGRLLEKGRRFTLSAAGILIEQKGVFSSKETAMRWQHLRMRTWNGTCIMECYSSGKKVEFQIWNMSNNVVFGGVLRFLLDKANYRLLEAANTRDVGQPHYAG